MEENRNEISLSGIFSLALVKKETYHGSFQGMRFRLCKAEDALQVCVYPEPYGWDATPDEQKEYQTFELSAEGIDEAVVWLNQKYRADYQQQAEKKKTD